jgi:nucleoid-associated protein YgaU
VWAAVSAGVLVVVDLALPAVHAAASAPATSAASAHPEVALTGLCATVALLVVAWLWVATGLVVLGALRGQGIHVPGLPAPLRRAVLAGCGVALASGLSCPVGATPGSPHQDRLRPTGDVELAGLPFPDRPTGDVAAQVRVRAGDSLWSIARRDLGAEADDAEIDAHWRAIYRLNRSVIGPDPDLIQPAQRLRLPHD